MLLDQNQEARRHAPYPHVEVEAHRPAVPARDAQLDQKHGIRHESREEAQDPIGGHEVDVARLVRHARPDGQGGAEEAVVGPEDLGVPGLGGPQEDEVGDD